MFPKPARNQRSPLRRQFNLADAPVAWVFFARDEAFIEAFPLFGPELEDRVPDAGSYAPVTILIDERPDGVHLSYDRMASFLAPYENAEALKVARDLDAKVEALLALSAA